MLATRLPRVSSCRWFIAGTGGGDGSCEHAGRSVVNVNSGLRRARNQPVVWPFRDPRVKMTTRFFRASRRGGPVPRASQKSAEKQPPARTTAQKGSPRPKAAKKSRTADSALFEGYLK